MYPVRWRSRLVKVDWGSFRIRISGGSAHCNDRMTARGQVSHDRGSYQSRPSYHGYLHKVLRLRRSCPSQRSSLPLRLVKRALPSPVPIVSTPQRFTSCMNGTSESPCTTPSLCMTTAVSCSPIWGIASTRLAGRLNLLLSQLPGRFCAPFSIEPSLSMTPGQAIPMKGASLNPSLSAFATRSLSILTRRFTAASRLGSSSVWRHSSDFHTLALDRSGDFLLRVSMTPQRMFVLPMSTARMES